eukprot:794230-Rhodomonas_salina.1
MNGDLKEDWKRATLVVSHLADCKDQRTLIALEFALKEPLGKSDEQQAEFQDSVDAFSTALHVQEGEKLTKDKVKVYEFEAFLKKKYLKKIDKRVDDFRAFLGDQRN